MTPEELLTALDTMRAERDEARRRSLENNMLAHKWMVAHDQCAAGLPYSFPSPADLPESEARATAAEAQAAALKARLEEALDREALARIIDPWPWSVDLTDFNPGQWPVRSMDQVNAQVGRAESLAKADAIIRRASEASTRERGEA